MIFDNILENIGESWFSQYSGKHKRKKRSQNKVMNVQYLLATSVTCFQDSRCDSWDKGSGILSKGHRMRIWHYICRISSKCSLFLFEECRKRYNANKLFILSDWIAKLWRYLYTNLYQKNIAATYLRHFSVPYQWEHRMQNFLLESVFYLKIFLFLKLLISQYHPVHNHHDLVSATEFLPLVVYRS